MCPLNVSSSKGLSGKSEKLEGFFISGGFVSISIVTYSGTSQLERSYHHTVFMLELL